MSRSYFVSRFLALFLSIALPLPPTLPGLRPGGPSPAFALRPREPEPGTKVQVGLEEALGHSPIVSNQEISSPDTTAGLEESPQPAVASLEETTLAPNSKTVPAGIPLANSSAPLDIGALLVFVDGALKAHDVAAVEQAFVRTLPYENVTLYLVRPTQLGAVSGYDVKNVFRKGFKEPSSAQEWESARYERGAALGGGDYYVENRQSLVQEEGGYVSVDPRFKRDQEEYGAEKARSVYYVVLRSREGIPWGLLLVSNWKTGNPIFHGNTPEEREADQERVRAILETLGHQGYIALENARAYEQLSHSLELERIGTVVAGYFHKLKNNLGVVATTAHVLLRLKKGPQSQELAEQVKELSSALGKETTTLMNAIGRGSSVPDVPSVQVSESIELLFRNASVDILSVVKARNPPEAVREVVTGYFKDKRIGDDKKAKEILDKWEELASLAIDSLMALDELRAPYPRFVQQYEKLIQQVDALVAVASQAGENPEIIKMFEAMKRQIEFGRRTLIVIKTRLPGNGSAEVKDHASSPSPPQDLVAVVSGLIASRQRSLIEEGKTPVVYQFQGLLAGEKSLYVSSDEAVLVQDALSELTHNAMKYGGSEISVSVLFDPDKNKITGEVTDRATPSDIAEGKKIGFPPNRVHARFVPGDRGDRPEREDSSGLGVATLQEEFDIRNGRLDLGWSELGKGSTFTFELTVTRQTPSPSKSEVSPSSGLEELPQEVAETLRHNPMAPLLWSIVQPASTQAIPQVVSVLRIPTHVPDVDELLKGHVVLAQEGLLSPEVIDRFQKMGWHVSLIPADVTGKRLINEVNASLYEWEGPLLVVVKTGLKEAVKQLPAYGRVTAVVLNPSLAPRDPDRLLRFLLEASKNLQGRFLEPAVFIQSGLEEELAVSDQL